METIVGALLGTLGVAVVTGVLGFATKMIMWAREDVKFYRERLLPAVEELTETVDVKLQRKPERTNRKASRE